MKTVPPFLACPECRSTVLKHDTTSEVADPPFDSPDGLRCSDCSRFFPIVDGIYVFWSDQLKKLELEESVSNSDLSDRVKQANIRIYDEISTEYGEHHDGTRPYSQTQLFQKAIATDFRSSKLIASDSVLVDVGCATGASLDLGSAGYKHTVGVDVSLCNLRAVAERGHIAVLADAEKLPFASASVDMFTCFATLHHFPNPQQFVIESHRCLRDSGVTLIAGEPSSNSMYMGPLAKLAWDSRKPVYRFLGRFSDRFYMHRNKDQQELNDLAEVNRTSGGFALETLDQFLANAGFDERVVFFGTDPSGYRRFSPPSWQQFVLRLLSFQNPFRRSNWANLTAMGRVSREHDSASDQLRPVDSSAQPAH